MSSKRKKNDSSDEESDEVDWQRKYRKMSKEFGKKMMRLTESREECNMKRGELHEMSSKNRELERRLKWANETLLRSQSMLNVRGVIEFLEGKQEMPDSVRQSDRHDRWEWIFDNDSNTQFVFGKLVTGNGYLLKAKAISSLSEASISIKFVLLMLSRQEDKGNAEKRSKLTTKIQKNVFQEEAYIAKDPALSNAQRDSEAVSAQRYWIAMGTRTDIVSDKVNFICNTNSIHLFLARLISETLNDRKSTFSMKEKTLPLCNAKLKHDENGIDEKQLDSLIEILNGWTGPKKVNKAAGFAILLKNNSTTASRSTDVVEWTTERKRCFIGLYSHFGATDCRQICIFFAPHFTAILLHFSRLSARFVDQITEKDANASLLAAAQALPSHQSIALKNTVQ
ncbi:unnamed protein product, partial [Mesorhabditis belari]|uniref:Uncharacterized protein n=1 Tax=Mesorhabditis belari TaxID=2138241 RepID=A0AAF3FQI4_9BILA